MTEHAKKEYQYNILGIDKKKEKLRKLYQLLFFYEITGFGGISLSEKQLDEFLSQVSLSRKDLVALETRPMASDGSVTHFKVPREIKILKVEIHTRNIRDISYSVTLPGFSINEIMVRQSKNKRSFYPIMFEHLKFSENELEKAFASLRKADLIRPIPEIIGGEIRYVIANEVLVKLIYEIHEIYKDKNLHLFVKSSLGEIDEKERLWLRNLFGQERSERILEDWKFKHRALEKFKNKERMQKLDEYLIKSIYERLEVLNKKYKQVLEEYDFPLNIIEEIII